MPRRTSIGLREITVKGEPYWQVTTPRTDGTPGRVRRTFKNRKEAQGYMQSIRLAIEAHGHNAGLISSELRMQAIEASRILEPTGATLVDAARYYASRHAIESRPVKDAASEFVSVQQLQP